MSGEELRRCCIYNQVDTLKEYLLLRANPCSTDEYGLSPLHYAIWNGNIECIKYLIMNPHGITRQRERVICINLRSIMGYTPLHLVALECPLIHVREVLFALLLNGADPKLLDEEGKNPIQLAKETKNQLFMDCFHEFISLQKESSSSKEQLKIIQQTLKKKYRLTPTLPGQQPSLAQHHHSDHHHHHHHHGKDALDGEEEVGSELLSARFSAASDGTSGGRGGKDTSPIRELPHELQYMINLTDKNTKILKPKELLVHENLLPSLTQISCTQLTGIESMKSLSFLKEEAIKNVQRREKLLQQSDQSLPNINIPQLIAVKNEMKTK